MSAGGMRCALWLTATRSVENSSRDVGGDQVEELVTAAGQNGPDGVEREPLCLLDGDGWRYRQLLARGHNVDDRRPVVRERVDQCLLQVGRTLDTTAEDAHRLSDGREVRVHQIGAE